MRTRLGLTQAELGERGPLHRNTISRIEGKAVTADDVEEGVLVLLSRALGVDVKVLKELGAVATHDEELPTALDPNPVREPLYLGPIYSSVSASRAEEQEGVNVGTAYLPSRHPDILLAVCRGRCQEPRYHDGEVIIFDLRRDELIPGRSYYVALNGAGNNTITFKQFVRFEGENCVFGCINREEFPRLLIIPRGHIERVAGTVGALRYD